MNYSPEDYTITVKRITEDDELLYRVTVAEFPDICSFSDTYTDAYETVIEAIGTLLEVAEEANEPMPAPIEGQNDYSGRITLRIPKSLHRDIAIKSDIEEVSINQYLLNIISNNNKSGVLTSSDRLYHWGETTTQLPSMGKTVSGAVQAALPSAYGSVFRILVAEGASNEGIACRWDRVIERKESTSTMPSVDFYFTAEAKGIR